MPYKKMYKMGKQIGHALRFAPTIYKTIRKGQKILQNQKQSTKQASKSRRVKSLHQKATAQGTSGYFSKFFYGKRHNPRGMSIYNKLAKNYQVINNSGRITSTLGKQGVNQILSLYNNGDLTTINNHLSSNNTNKVFHFSVSAEILMTNQSNVPCRLALYDIIARRDLSASNVQAPDNAWENSYADEGGNNTDCTVIGTTPFSSDLFTQFFVVKKITHVQLGPGQVHSHRVSFTPRKLVDFECVQYAAYGIKGLTCFTLAVQHGFPDDDSSSHTTVTAGTSAIDYVYRKQYKYSWIQDIDTNYYKANNLPTGYAGVEYILDQAFGGATGVASA